MHPKQNQKQVTHESNKHACFKLEEKAPRSVEKNKNNILSLLGDNSP